MQQRPWLQNGELPSAMLMARSWKEQNKAIVHIPPYHPNIVAIAFVSFRKDYLDLGQVSSSPDPDSSVHTLWSMVSFPTHRCHHPVLRQPCWGAHRGLASWLPYLHLDAIYTDFRGASTRRPESTGLAFCIQRHSFGESGEENSQITSPVSKCGQQPRVIRTKK